jgi:hypothetical protein
MRVDTNNCQTVEEKLDEVNNQLDQTGDFFSFDVHPNVVRADKIRSDRLWKRRLAIIHSAEYQFAKE